MPLSAEAEVLPQTAADAPPWAAEAVRQEAGGGVQQSAAV